MRDFDVTGPLPEQGTTLLEASAGTGKTYTVGALVTRYVAEGRARLGEMLVITFGRAARQELRERVRDALVGAERALSDPSAADRSDTLVGWLLAQDESARPAMRERLRDALADFDSATIATTHQFCQLVLRSLGVAGDTEAGGHRLQVGDEHGVEPARPLLRSRSGVLGSGGVGGGSSGLGLVGHVSPSHVGVRRGARTCDIRPRGGEKARNGARWSGTAARR